MRGQWSNDHDKNPLSPSSAGVGVGGNDGVKQAPARARQQGRRLLNYLKLFAVSMMVIELDHIALGEGS